MTCHAKPVPYRLQPSTPTLNTRYQISHNRSGHIFTLSHHFLPTSSFRLTMRFRMIFSGVLSLSSAK